MGRDGLQNLAPFGGEPVEQGLRIFEAIARRRPFDAVAIDRHPAFALWVHATAAAVHQTIDEEQGITLVHVDRHRAIQIVHAVEIGVIAGVGVGKVRFVTARYDHGGAIAFVDIG